MIGSSDLRPEDVPADDAPWEEIGEFALAFDGYRHWGSFEACSRIADARKHDTLDEARTCLFFEQRSWRHRGREPDGEAMDYIRSLLRIIRDKAAQPPFPQA